MFWLCDRVAGIAPVTKYISSLARWSPERRKIVEKMHSADIPVWNNAAAIFFLHNNASALCRFSRVLCGFSGATRIINNL